MTTWRGAAATGQQTTYSGPSCDQSRAGPGANGYFLEKSQSARLTPEKACEVMLALTFQAAAVRTSLRSSAPSQ